MKMVLPPVSHVERSSRGMAHCIFYGGLVYVAVGALVSIVKIVIQEESPTETTMVDGTVGTNWGVMPSFLVVGFNGGAFETGAINSIFGNDWRKGYKKVGSDGGAKVTPWATKASPRRLIVNMSTLAPIFTATKKDGTTDKIAVHQPPKLQVWAHRKPSGAGIYSLCTIAPGAPANVLTSDDLTLEYVTCNLEIYMSAAQSIIQTISVAKRFIPLKKRYWGFPGEKATQEVYSLTAGSSEFTHPARNGNANLILWFVVDNPIVEVVRPVSVIAQFNRGLAAFGGQMALVSTVFAFIFVKKFEKSAISKVEDVLTPRWKKSKEHFPDDPEKYLLAN